MIFKVFYLKGISLRIYSMIRIDGVFKKKDKKDLTLFVVNKMRRNFFWIHIVKRQNKTFLFFIFIMWAAYFNNIQI